MGRILSLAHLTVMELSPPDVITAAADVGFDAVGLRLHNPRPGASQFPMLGDAPMMWETQRRLRDTGVTVLDVELIWLEAATRIEDYIPMMEAAARLGAKRILTGGRGPDLSAIADRYAQACDAAAPLGLAVDIEFMPWSGVPGLPQAGKVVAAANRPNGGMLFDALHVDRSGAGLAEIASVDPKLLGYAHLCDAPAERPPSLEAMGDEARDERLPPGEGGLQLVDFLRALPKDLPLGIEVPMKRLSQTVPALERARRVLDATKRLLESFE